MVEPSQELATLRMPVLTPLLVCIALHALCMRVRAMPEH